MPHPPYPRTLFNACGDTEGPERIGVPCHGFHSEPVNLRCFCVSFLHVAHGTEQGVSINCFAEFLNCFGRWQDGPALAVAPPHHATKTAMHPIIRAIQSDV